jgi:hypothetical protein
MSTGLSLTKADLDNRMASVWMGIRDNLRRASELCALLNDTSIIAADPNYLQNVLGYTSGEVTTLRAAWTDLGGTGTSLYRIATGAVAGPGSPNDFFFNAKHLSGFITS